MNNLAVDIGIKFFGGQGGSHGGVGSSFANLSGIGYLVSLIVKGSFVLSGIIILFFGIAFATATFTFLSQSNIDLCFFQSFILSCSSPQNLYKQDY